MEVGLLVLAIALFAVGTFFFMYQSAPSQSMALAQSIAYPYRAVALAFVGLGSVSMLTASILYIKKTKQVI